MKGKEVTICGEGANSAIVMRQMLLCIASVLAFSSDAFAFQVVGVSDGDTMTVLVDRKPLIIRLANIDAPEKNQAFGQLSKQSLSSMCWGKDAQYDALNQDKYGRTIGIVRCGGIEVNRAQVERGMAWVYTQYNKDTKLPSIERASQARHLGVWTDKNPTPPWEFRHKKTANIQASSEAITTCHIGPRGGRYTIIHGHKRYGC